VADLSTAIEANAAHGQLLGARDALRGKLDTVRLELVSIDAEREQIAFAAHTGDKAAEQRMAKLNRFRGERLLMDHLPAARAPRPPAPPASPGLASARHRPQG
jgi:hypothetical protein